MKIWITKWALTRGILTVDDAETTHTPTMVSFNIKGYTVCMHGKDWHLDEVSARRRAEHMAADKVAAAEKAIAKLRGKTGDKFKVSEFK